MKQAASVGSRFLSLSPTSICPIHPLEGSITLLKLTCHDRFHRQVRLQHPASIPEGKTFWTNVIKEQNRAFDEIVTAVKRIITIAIFRILGWTIAKTQRSILSAMLLAQKFRSRRGVLRTTGPGAIAVNPDASFVLTDYHMGDMNGYH